MSTMLTSLADLAADINQAYDRVAVSAVETLDAAYSCGKLLCEAKGLVAHGEWIPWLEENTRVTPRQSQKWMRLYTHWEQLPERKTEEHLTINGALKLVSPPAKEEHRSLFDDQESKNELSSHLDEEDNPFADDAEHEDLDDTPDRPAKVRHNTGNEEWYTPPEYLEAARQVMGGFDLDPASSDEANELVGAATYFTKADDGLAQDWVGKVWLNPPYTTGVIDAFVSKLVASDATEAILLVNNSTDTGWFALASSTSTAMCLPTGRIRFIDGCGKYGDEMPSPLQGQAILYFGERTQRFGEQFEQFGPVWVKP